ncbi:hypothetical protein MMC25_004880 [Agyrium rufum]|nr:hypothetical protein [Agyrium rufum]
MVGKGKGKAGPSKTSAPSNDDSYIVFSNAKGDLKPKKPATSTDPKPGGDGSPDAVKKPDTRALIAGSSWTGKLPVNLLSEHCQKQKWEKPEYTMSRNPKGFSSSVILKSVHPRTKESMALPPLQLPLNALHLSFQPSAVEARHFAATYAMFRVCSMKSIHTMLPPNYRDLWKHEFAELKKSDLAEGKGFMYEADPFTAKIEREEAQALIAKQRVDREKQKDHGVSSQPGGIQPAKTRGWSGVPSIDMGKRSRLTVEDLIRRYDSWNPEGSTISPDQRSKIMDELQDLGFRPSHVEEAILECKNREEVLEWLLIHVPEDDLPTWSLPEGYVAGITLASGNMKREAGLKRLGEAGYAPELCEKVLDEHNGNEALAAESLQNILVIGHASKARQGSEKDLTGNTEDSDIWSEEHETLESIYEKRYEKIDKHSCQVQLQNSRYKPTYLLKVQKSKNYPATPPIISLLGPRLPAFIKLAVISKAIKHCQDELLDLPMVYNLVDWVETNVEGIIDNPGKLRDVAAASNIGHADETQRQSRRRHNQRHPKLIDWRPGSEASKRIASHWQDKQKSPRYQKMVTGRKTLPAWALGDAIVATVAQNQVTIISGETGSGKSTQSVQFILDDMIQRQLGSAANIICTQPRRISALGLASRVSEERYSTLGDEVGYAIRGESKLTRGATKITFVTTGVLLRRLQTSGGSQDDVVASLADVSHVVVDEVHERSLDTDFLLVLLRDILPKRKDMKLILMSATLDADGFQRYFKDNSSVGMIEIQGRTFPVQDYYLDDILRLTSYSPTSSARNKSNEVEETTKDLEPSLAHAIQNLGMGINYDLVAATVRAIDKELGSKEGGILIFVPGVMEINRTLDAINSIPNVHALPLHASLLPDEQRRVFPPAPRGKRKVIAATNVAETSITIPDIVAVIDTGKVKETSFDPQNNMVKLEETWASRAACKQRRGRAGRVQAGICYKLYTKNLEMKMAERPDPEIRRVPLEQLCLHVRAMGIEDVAGFLSRALTPPDTLAIDTALDLLQNIGALDGTDLTSLGQNMAQIPADLRCSKLMIYGALFGCLEPCLTIAAILTVKSPFVSPQSKREESKAVRLTFAADQGDLMADLTAFDAWNKGRSSSSPREVRGWCDSNFLSYQTLMDISTNRLQYVSALKESGFIPASYQSSTILTGSSPPPALLRALVASAFTPQFATIKMPSQKFASSVSGAVALDPESREIRYFTKDSGRVFVHPSSTCFAAQNYPGNAAFMSFFTKMATSKIFIRELTPFNVYALLMLGGGRPEIDTLGRGMVVDQWVRVRGWARIGVLVRRLRVLVDRCLGEGLDDPGAILEERKGGGWRKEVLTCVGRLIEYDGLD